MLAASSKILNKNYHIDTNMRTKKLHFVERYNGQFIKNSIFKLSVLIWNKIIDDELNLWGILTYKQAKTKFKIYFYFYPKKIHQWQPMVNYHGKI